MDYATILAHFYMTISIESGIVPCALPAIAPQSRHIKSFSIADELMSDMSPEELYIAKRKFRKLWRKEVKRMSSALLAEIENDSRLLAKILSQENNSRRSRRAAKLQQRIRDIKHKIDKLQNLDKFDRKKIVHNMILAKAHKAAIGKP